MFLAPAVPGPAVIINGWLEVPFGVTDLSSFREWLHSEQVPERLRLSWSPNTLWVDADVVRLSREVAVSLLSPPPSPPTALPGRATTPRPALLIEGVVRVPAGVDDLASFRAWALSEDAPGNVRLAWLDGTLWIDATMEQIYTHNRVKTEVVRVLGDLIELSEQGFVLSDGAVLSHPGAGLSTIPDGIYLSHQALQVGRVREVPGRRTGVVELEGSPEMVLEVVSDTSVEKDTQMLPPLYHQAGIVEFWRIDARAALVFEVFTSTAGGWQATQQPDGWWASPVFGGTFQMEQTTYPGGQPRFQLHYRP